MYQLQGRYLQNQVHLLTVRPLVRNVIMTESLSVTRSYCVCVLEINTENKQQAFKWHVFIKPFALAHRASCGPR